MPDILRAICFSLALLCFVVDAFKGGRAAVASRVDWALIPLGLALFVLPFAWDAWEKVG
jgi:hypothetical protein